MVEEQPAQQPCSAMPRRGSRTWGGGPFSRGFTAEGDGGPSGRRLCGHRSAPSPLALNGGAGGCRTHPRHCCAVAAAAEASGPCRPLSPYLPHRVPRPFPPLSLCVSVRAVPVSAGSTVLAPRSNLLSLRQFDFVLPRRSLFTALTTGPRDRTQSAWPRRRAEPTSMSLSFVQLTRDERGGVSSAIRDFHLSLLRAGPVVAPHLNPPQAVPSRAVPGAGWRRSTSHTAQ